MTLDDLINFLELNNINKRYYSLDGKIKDDAFHLKKKDNKWEVFYFERGKKSQNKEFDNIEDAIFSLYNIFADAIKTVGDKAFPN